MTLLERNTQLEIRPSMMKNYSTIEDNEEGEK